MALTEHLRVTERTLLRKDEEELSVSGRFRRSQRREIDDSKQRSGQGHRRMARLVVIAILLVGAGVLVTTGQ